jgi:HEAT repeat protein
MMFDMSGSTLRKRGLLVVALAAGTILTPGCQSSPKSGAAAPTNPQGTKNVGTIAASTLRESAITTTSARAKSENPAVRANAVEAAGLAGRRLSTVIEAGLRDTNPGVRAVAATVIGREKLTKLAPAAAGLQRDSSPYVRASSIYAAARCGLEADRSPLGSILTEGANTRERAHAAVLIGELGEKSALPMLRQAASRRVQRASALENRLLELQIAEAMVKLGDEEQVQTVRASLYPSRPEELEAAALGAQILGNLKDKGSVGQLVQMAGGIDGKATLQMPAEIRLAAVTALAKMGYRDGAYVADQYAVDPNPALRAQAAFAYGQIRSPESLARLAQMLQDTSETVSVSAAAAILSDSSR